MSSHYGGEVLNECGVLNVSLATIAIVAVSGSSLNLCGHLILHSPSRGGTYFHIAGRNTYPHYMNEAGYRRYLRENRKRELRRRFLQLPRPHAAEAYLERLLADTWAWRVLPHNCVAFVEAIIAAGGGTWASYSNCPTIATADGIEDRAARFMQTLEGQIVNLYGVPR